MRTTPPMGWNSWDCFGTTVTEAEVLANAEFMAEHLLRHGWDTVVVDIAWYDPTAKAHGYNDGAPLELDGFGRPLPAPNRFPSAAGSAGFGPLAARVHELGLRFGVHVMRGIPRLAVERDLPVLGTDITARDVADLTSPCPVEPRQLRPRSQPPGRSDLLRHAGRAARRVGRGLHQGRRHALAVPRRRDRGLRPGDRAQRPTHRAVALPGAGRLAHAARAPARALHDVASERRPVGPWEDIEAQFSRMARWAPHSGPEGWADADMLPLGHIGIRAERGEDRHSRLTPAEQVTLMTLWVIARSPLMMGGDLATSSPETIALLTNDAVLDVLREARDSREVLREGDLVLWAARSADPDGPRYAAAFHLGSTPATASLRLDTIDGRDGDRVTDLWSGAAVEVHDRHVELRIEPHGARLLRLTS